MGYFNRNLKKEEQRFLPTLKGVSFRAVNKMNKNYKQNFIRAGAIAREVRAFGKDLIRKGASYNDVIARVNQKIVQLGAKPAFPPQIALNDIAAHFLPSPGQDIIFDNEVIKLDVGICYEGAIGDCAVTIDLSGKYQKLVDAAEAALFMAEQSLYVGQPLSEIGSIIEKTIVSRGFKPVKNLAGHGLGHYQIHTPPSIPNYKDKSKGRLTKAMTFAIEPFATTGQGMIYEEGEPEIFCFLKEFSSPLLEKIKTFQGLPFATHNLLPYDSSLSELKKELFRLIREGSLVGYGPLIEETHGIVVQAENSVLIDENGEILITTR